MVSFEGRHEIKGQGHVRLKLDLRTWQKCHSRPLRSDDNDNDDNLCLSSQQAVCGRGYACAMSHCDLWSHRQCWQVRYTHVVASYNM